MAHSTPEHPDSSAAWSTTSENENSFRRQYMIPADSIEREFHVANDISLTPAMDRSLPSGANTVVSETEKVSRDSSADMTAHASASKPSALPTPIDSTAENSDNEKADEDGGFEPIKSAKSVPKNPITRTQSGRQLTEDDLFRALSRRRTNASGQQGSFTTADTEEEQAEVERLMSQMFGRNRQENSEEEKTRHVGLVFKNLTVKGMGLGAALQGTLGDILLGLPRLFKSLAGRGPKRLTSKPPIRTLLDNFTGCIRPGEMLLVLGRPGSGCSTFLKVLANQRFGYESVDGDVSYGGTDAKIMARDYRGEIVYNPEDDLHYATLSVKRTLAFALKTRTPGKASRNEGESRAEYVKEFLRVVSKLFWIEHTSPYQLEIWPYMYGMLTRDL